MPPKAAGVCVLRVRACDARSVCTRIAVHDPPAAQRTVLVQQSGTRHTGCDESGGWIWPSARLLEETLLAERPSWAGVNVLELGSGTGYLALRLAQAGARVTATDRGGAMKLLEQNIRRNQQRFGTQDGEELLQVGSSVLDWEAEDIAAAVATLQHAAPT